MPHIPVWAVFQTATDSCIAPAAAFDVIVSLDSHGSATDSWNQRRYDGHVVGDGEYRIEVAYSVRFNPWVLTTTATTFEISGNCPTTGVEGIQWHRFKNLFR